jgi:hypothetical protein
MSATEGSSSPVSSSSSHCIDGINSDSNSCSNAFYIKRNALKKRSAEMYQLATELIARKSEYADYAVDKYVDALKACTLHGETEWDAIFDQSG